MTTQPKAPARPVSPRLWGAVALTGAAVGLGALVPVQAQGASFTLQAPETLWLAQAEGGESGEGGAFIEAAPDVAYLGRLALVEGHLKAGALLYRIGKPDEAAAMIGHPEAEMMEELREAMAQRGVADFTPGIEAMADAIYAEASPDDVDAALANVSAQIVALANANAPPQAHFTALVTMVRSAAAEYGEAVEEGDLSEAAAYQEAIGFVDVARAMADRLAASDDEAVSKAGEKALAALAEADAAFDGMAPAPGFKGDATVLNAVAARIELAAYQVR